MLNGSEVPAKGVVMQRIRSGSLKKFRQTRMLYEKETPSALDLKRVPEAPAVTNKQVVIDAGSVANTFDEAITV